MTKKTIFFDDPQTDPDPNQDHCNKTIFLDIFQPDPDSNQDHQPNLF